ncbi:MAG: hypothetical protein AAFV72_02090 [Cyanobacteria bacterium J06635_1]
MSSEASRPPESTESTPTQTSNPSADTTNTDADRPTLMGPPKRPEKPPEPVAPPAAVPKAASPKAETSAAKASPEIVAINPVAAIEPVVTDEPETSQDTQADSRPRQHPISPPSEPMQYRAIGLLRGRYCPSEENFNRGYILTQDDTQVSSVLLGRVTSLVKKHLEIESNHLWVVYPRTIADEDNALSVQIVGVWEPETLGVEDEETEAQETEAQEIEAQKTEAQEIEAQETEAQEAEVQSSETGVEATTEVPEASEAEKADESVGADEPESSDAAVTETKSDAKPEVPPIPSDELQSDYFSIRGEVVKYVEDKAEIHINVLQKLRSNSKQRPFRLVLSGHLEGKTIGYFWDLNVERQAQHLVLTEGTQIAAVPPKKKKKGGRRGGPGGGKRFSKGGPRSGGPRSGGGNQRYSNDRGDKAPPSRPTRSTASEVANADKN